MRIANLNAYKLKLDARGSAAWQARVTAVHEIGPHILGLQEVVVDESATATEEWDESAAETIKAFAADCGLTASVEATPGYPYGAAMAANSHRPWYTALLWDPNAARGRSGQLPSLRRTGLLARIHHRALRHRCVRTGHGWLLPR